MQNVEIYCDYYSELLGMIWCVGVYNSSLVDIVGFGEASGKVKI